MNRVNAGPRSNTMFRLHFLYPNIWVLLQTEIPLEIEEGPRFESVYAHHISTSFYISLRLSIPRNSNRDTRAQDHRRWLDVRTRVFFARLEVKIYPIHSTPKKIDVRKLTSSSNSVSAFDLPK